MGNASSPGEDSKIGVHFLMTSKCEAHRQCGSGFGSVDGWTEVLSVVNDGAGAVYWQLNAISLHESWATFRPRNGGTGADGRRAS